MKKNYLLGILLVIIVFVASHFTAIYFGYLYNYLFPEQLVGGWIGSDDAWMYIVGVPLSFTLFLMLLFTTFGDKHKYWWIGILLVPVLIFEVVVDLEHIYLPIIIGLVGWSIGLGIQKLKAR